MNANWTHVALISTSSRQYVTPLSLSLLASRAGEVPPGRGEPRRSEPLAREGRARDRQPGDPAGERRQPQEPDQILEGEVVKISLVRDQ